MYTYNEDNNYNIDKIKHRSYVVIYYITRVSDSLLRLRHLRSVIAYLSDGPFDRDRN